MKANRIAFVLTVLLLCLLWACESQKPVVVKTTETTEETAWRNTCSRCHTLDDANPKAYPAAEWPRIVNNMQHKGGTLQFSDSTKDLVVKYLVANAGR